MMDASKLTEAERAIFRAGMVHAFDVMKVGLFGGDNAGMAPRGKTTIHPDPSPEWVAQKRAREAEIDARLRFRGHQF